MSDAAPPALIVSFTHHIGRAAAFTATERPRVVLPVAMPERFIIMAMVSAYGSVERVGNGCRAGVARLA